MLKIVLGTLFIAALALLVLWVVLEVGRRIERAKARRNTIEDTPLPKINTPFDKRYPYN